MYDVPTTFNTICLWNKYKERFIGNKIEDECVFSKVFLLKVVSYNVHFKKKKKNQENIKLLLKN